MFIDTTAEAFDAELLSFYEDYMAVIETPDRLDDSRFALTGDTRKGVDALLETLHGLDAAPIRVGLKL